MNVTTFNAATTPIQKAEGVSASQFTEQLANVGITIPKTSVDTKVVRINSPDPVGAKTETKGDVTNVYNTAGKYIYSFNKKTGVQVAKK